MALEFKWAKFLFIFLNFFFKVIDQNSQNVGFGSMIQEPFGLAYFWWFLRALDNFTKRCIFYFSKKKW